MKTFRSFILLFFVAGILFFSCSEVGENAEISEDLSVNAAFLNEAKAFVQNKEIFLPDMAYTMKQTTTPKSVSSSKKGFALEWEHALFMEGGKIDVLMIPIHTDETTSVVRYFKEKNKKGKTVLTPLYSYLSVIKDKTSGEILGRLVSYGPDVRFLRNHKLSFDNFIEKSPLNMDYSGLYLVSGIDGQLKSGILYYRGDVKYKFTTSGETQSADLSRKTEKKDFSSKSVFSLSFVTDPLLTKGICNCKDNESDSEFFICDGCGQYSSECKCCFSGGDVCERCGENPCIICARCIECGKYTDECTCNFCEYCNNFPCNCPECLGCGKKYPDCTCSDMKCSGTSCRCPRCNS